MSVGYNKAREEADVLLRDRDTIIEELRARIQMLESSNSASVGDGQQRQPRGDGNVRGDAARPYSPPYGTYPPDYGYPDAVAPAGRQSDWELPYRPPSPEYHPPPIEHGWTAGSPQYTPPSPLPEPTMYSLSKNVAATSLEPSSDDFRFGVEWQDGEEISAAAWMQEGGERLVAEVMIRSTDFVDLTDPRTGLSYPVGRYGEMYWDGELAWDQVDTRRVWGSVRKGGKWLPMIRKGTAEWEKLARVALKIPFKHRGAGQKQIASQALRKHAQEKEALASIVMKETGIQVEKDFMSVAPGKGRIAIPFAVRRRFTVERAKQQVWIEYNLHDVDTWLLLDRLRPRDVKSQDWISALGQMAYRANRDQERLIARMTRDLLATRSPTPYDGKLDDVDQLFTTLVQVGVHWDRILVGDVYDFIKCWYTTEREKEEVRKELRSKGLTLAQINDELVLRFERDPRVQIAVDAPPEQHPLVKFFTNTVLFSSVYPVTKLDGWTYREPDDIRRPFRVNEGEWVHTA